MAEKQAKWYRARQPGFVNGKRMRPGDKFQWAGKPGKWMEPIPDPDDGALVPVDSERVEAIREALEKADHADSMIWTSAGLIKSAWVRNAMDDPSVTREEIETAWPDFVRIPPKRYA